MSNSLLVNDSSSKKRLPNYSDTDKQIFLSIFEKYKNIIENKKTDSIVGMQKKKPGKTSQNYTTPTYYKLEILSNCNNSGEIKKKKQKTKVVREGEATFKLVVQRVGL